VLNPSLMLLMRWILEGKNPNENDCTNNESNEIGAFRP
jgi:hypothetical protein